MSKTSAQFNRRKPAAQAAEGNDALLDAWEKTRRENANRAAIFDQHGNVVCSFSQIEVRAAEFVRKLQSFSPGQIIAIQIGNHPDWPSVFLACLRTRLVVLPLEQTINDDHRKAVFEACNVVAAAILGGRDVRVERLPHAQRKPAATFRGKLQPSLLKLTSGTTAAPRAIRFRSQQLLADCENICDTMGITPRDLNFGVIPISHSYGFSNLLTPLLARGVPMALSNDRMPRAILDGIAASGATVFPGMPIFYQSLCELDTPPLLKLRLCISAGAPLSTKISELFREKFGCAIHSFYGSSECGGICYAREPSAIPGFVGPAMRSVKIELLNSHDAPVAGRAGVPASRIRIRSRAVADGYFPEPDEAKLGHRTFLPDDLLEKMPDGYRVVGRVSDLINVAGKKVHPAQIEAEILRCKGVREAIVFARDSERRNEEIVACVVATGAVSEDELLSHCRARLSSWQTPRRIFLIDQMPVNERGKISRRELARIYASEKGNGKLPQA
jgi:long-chain acyl-CoA synthetase